MVEACGDTVMIGVASSHVEVGGDEKLEGDCYDNEDTNVCAEEVFVRGKNKYNVGLPTEAKVQAGNSLIKVPKLSNIRLLALGSNHGAAVDIYNNLFTWGMNINANCGLGSRFVNHIRYIIKHLVIFSYCQNTCLLHRIT